MKSWLSSVATQIVGVGPAALLGTHRGRRMDSIGGARIAVDQIGFAPIDSLEDELRALRRERDALRRANRVLKLEVVELERVSERDTPTPLFNRRDFLTAIHQSNARFARPAPSAAKTTRAGQGKGRAGVSNTD